ncbi:MAG: nucleolar 14 family protein [Deltaproteobacteria bacterium]|nr:nucleolar 14 family protein [Deltaproteobacteria bacterium]
MKLFTAVLTAALATAALASAAHAQPGSPPGPAYDDYGLGLEADVDVNLDADVAQAPVGPGASQGRHAQRARLKAMLKRRFDRNHDGRLDRRERRAAIRFLRHRARQMARHQRDMGGPPGSYPR